MGNVPGRGYASLAIVGPPDQRISNDDNDFANVMIYHFGMGHGDFRILMADLGK